MQANVGSLDRTLRVLAGAALILFACLSTSALRWWGWVGIVPLATGALGWCPLYTPFRISTRRSG